MRKTGGFLEEAEHRNSAARLFPSSPQEGVQNRGATRSSVAATAAAGSVSLRQACLTAARLSSSDRGTGAESPHTKQTYPGVHGWKPVESYPDKAATVWHGVAKHR
ncbi:hypothetical protein MTO96_032245 [Rhipicephalus appendiculatus]